jgi:hypothetical protein
MTRLSAATRGWQAAQIQTLDLQDGLCNGFHAHFADSITPMKDTMKESPCH